MQRKPDDTPKIIGLGIGIAIFIGIIAFQIYRAMQNTGASATPPPVTATLNATNAPLQVASAANAAPKAGDGQMRYFDDQLDADPVPGQMPPGLAGRADAFQPIKAPVVAKPTPIPSVSRASSLLSPGKRGSKPIFLEPGIPTPGQTGRLDWVSSRNDIPQRNDAPKSSAPPPLEVHLDGVYTGRDGFAVLTLQEGHAAGQSVYKRVGDRIARYWIVAVSDGGVTLKGRAMPWLVGQTLRFGDGVITEVPAAPGNAAASSGSSPAVPLSITPDKVSLSPPTQTP